MKKLILLDVDGTITNSGCKIDSKMENILILLSQNFELGIVGGGKIDKIIWQLENIKEIFLHIILLNVAVYIIKTKNLFILI